MGYDRWFRRYWFFEVISGFSEATAEGKIYVEPTPEWFGGVLKAKPKIIRDRWLKECTKTQESGNKVANVWGVINDEDKVP